MNYLTWPESSDEEMDEWTGGDTEPTGTIVIPPLPPQRKEYTDEDGQIPIFAQWSPVNATNSGGVTYNHVNGRTFLRSLSGANSTSFFFPLNALSSDEFNAVQATDPLDDAARIEIDVRSDVAFSIGLLATNAIVLNPGVVDGSTGVKTIQIFVQHTSFGSPQLLRFGFYILHNSESIVENLRVVALRTVVSPNLHYTHMPATSIPRTLTKPVPGKNPPNELSHAPSIAWSITYNGVVRFYLNKVNIVLRHVGLECSGECQTKGLDANNRWGWKFHGSGGGQNLNSVGSLHRQQGQIGDVLYGPFDEEHHTWEIGSDPTIAVTWCVFRGIWFFEYK